MTLEQIKAALSNGLIVCWKNNDYQVNQDSTGRYLITYRTGNTIGLTHQDGTTLNGQPEDFYTLSKPTLTTTTGVSQ